MTKPTADLGGFPLILASGSPRRRELLASLALDFEVIPPTVDEKSFNFTGQSPADKVLFLSRVKAQEVAARHPVALVIGSDTIVVLDREILEKPEDRSDAFRMLYRLQGATHTVYSAITLIHPEKGLLSDYLTTQVTMRPLREAEIARYIDTDEPMDKAGAYAIQGFGSLIVEKIDGCYFNVVGMSLYLLGQLFERHGLRLL